MGSLFSKPNKFFRHSNISTNARKLPKFLQAMHHDNPYASLFKLFPDMDELAQCAGHAFLLNKISSEQFSSLLQLRTMNMEALSLELIPILTPEGNLSDVAEQKLNFMTQKRVTAFINELHNKPKSEHFLYKITMPSIRDKRVHELLLFAANLEAVMLSGSPILESEEESAIDSPIEISGFLSGSLHASLKSKFGRDTKKSFPFAGVLSIDDIADSMMKSERPISVAYPGIANSEQFHEINAGQFYSTLHDWLHFNIISSIPTEIYQGILSAINLVREKTGIKWSKEIWDSLDMDLGMFLNHQILDEALCINFLDALNEVVSTEGRPFGLFSATALNDTMWLFIIDIVLQGPKWEQLIPGILPFPENTPYTAYYRFTHQHRKLLENQSPARQVAILKSLWFQIPLPSKEPLFVKTSRAEGNFIQIEIDGKPIKASKRDALIIKRVEINMHQDAMTKEQQQLFADDLLSNPYRFRALMKRFELNSFIKLFPNHRCTLCETPDFFKHYLADPSCLASFLWISPIQNKAMFDYIQTHWLRSIDLIDKFIYLTMHIEFIVNAFPDYQNDIFNALEKKFSQAGLLRTYIRSYEDVNRLFTCFPKHKERMYRHLSNLAQTYPYYEERITNASAFKEYKDTRPVNPANRGLFHSYSTTSLSSLWDSTPEFPLGP